MRPVDDRLAPLDDPQHLISRADFHDIVAAARKDFGHIATIGLVRPVTPNKARVYIRRVYYDNGGTNYLEVERIRGQWKITRDYTEQFRTLDER